MDNTVHERNNKPRFRSILFKCKQTHIPTEPQLRYNSKPSKIFPKAGHCGWQSNEIKLALVSKFNQILSQAFVRKHSLCGGFRRY